ncbi:hypothetical protein BH10PAT1_BH10PAT1_0990 [soil metagenome]
MYNHLLYLSYWLINSLTLYLFNLIFPSNFVLGNWKFNPIEAAIYAGFWVTFFIWIFWDFAIAKKIKFDTAIVTYGYFFFVNIFAFWLVSRFPGIAGFGISSWVVATGIALVALLLQRLAWRTVIKS